MSTTAELTEKPQLARDLRQWDLVALMMNSIIGAGIFGLPARAFALAGPYSLLAFVVCAVPVLLMVSCFAEVGSRFSSTGGLYVYAREAFGPFVGFQIGWLGWLARLTAFAALCNLFVDYVGYFLPSIASGYGRIALIIVVVAVLTEANIAGVRTASWFGNMLTIAKLVPLLLLIVAGLRFVHLSTYSQAAPPGYNAFSGAVLILVFAFSGWENVVIPAGEACDPRRHLPFALIGGTGATVLLYIAIQAVCIGTVPGLGTSQKPLADAGARLFGTPGASIIAAGALVSVLGTMHAIVLSAPRLLYAMAERGQLPRSFAITHRRYLTPHVAILFSSTAMLALTLPGTFASAATASTIFRLITYAATCAVLPILRRRPGADPALFRLPAGDVVAVIALALSAWLLSSSPLRDANQVLFAIVIGLILYVVSSAQVARSVHWRSG